MKLKSFQTNHAHIETISGTQKVTSELIAIDMKIEVMSV